MRAKRPAAARFSITLLGWNIGVSDYVALALGVVCAGIGGELFVRGVVGLARWARVSPGIFAATVAAFATSSPELSVSINAALAGTPQIALGDALGSNVVNVALILGAALVIAGFRSSRGSVQRDFPVALVVPILTFVLLIDGVLSRWDAALMLWIFVAWLAAAVLDARRERSSAAVDLGGVREWPVILTCIVGLAFLVGAGNLIVAGAQGIAIDLGMDEFIIGASIVAVGTSTPELATTIVAKLRGHDAVGLGTILGSNIFNGLFIVAVAAVIHPITVAWHEVVVALVFGLVALAFTYPSRTGLIGRCRGVLLLVLYAAYLIAIV